MPPSSAAAAKWASIKATGIKIGGKYTPSKDPPYLKHRLEVFDRIKAKYDAQIAGAYLSAELDNALL